MQPTDLDVFGGKQIAQHPAAREREVDVQLVEPPHDGKIGNRGGSRQITNAAAARAVSGRYELRGIPAGAIF